MDDSCAVCAESLEWVAYGSCGHRDVCSTCVARLRFICNDRRCCICKTESPVVFVTKALGEYTVTISDFTVLPSEVKEGRVGKYWYHEDTEAYFDDVDHYKMVKAMCRLSCSVCDGESNEGGAVRRKERFRNIGHLKGHLFRRHNLFMCSLCLEGRKIFICEQKLYSRQQLNQHIRTGDSEVDGNESERGGFMGHPMCEFCRTPFYGDNELYSHMSTEHYTCHICQRQHPGQYEYYKNYDDLEIHFRRDHFLCEDEACLAKKFVVFQSEAEIKRHNTIEHAGRMSRSKRSAALQIPTSFRYQRSSEQDRRGRGRTFRRDQSDDQLSIAIQASLESAHSEGTSHDPLPSSNERTVLDHGNFEDIDSLVHPFETLTSTDPEASSRYLQALGHSSRNAPLVESSFPPLQTGSSSSQQKANHESEGLSNNTMAARLRHQSNRKATAHNSAHAWPAASHGQVPSSSTQNWPTLNTPAVSSRSSASGSAPQNWPTLNNTTAATSRSSASGSAVPSYASSTQALPQPAVTQGHLSSVSTGNLNNSRMSHSASAPNLTENGSLKPTSSDFPPISAIQARKSPSSSHVLPKVEDVQSANRSLVEKMRSALEYDEDKYASFRDISAQFRQGSIETEKYLYHVQQYGLSHLVLELARLCPDPQKQKELIEYHNANLRGNVPKQNEMAHDNIPVRAGNGSKKGKGIAAETSSYKHRMADNFMSTVRTLQSNFKSEEEEVEVLAKDGYRGDKGRSNVMADEQLVELRGRNDSASIDDVSHRNSKDGNNVSKQRKKTSKFNRVRLGDGSMASILNVNNSNSDPEPEVERSSEPSVSVPVRGVWRKGGGQKLFP